MLKVGVTGGIGSGKSTACKVFETLGIPVFYADTEAKKLLNDDNALKEQVRAVFGSGIYGPEGLRNKELAQLVFNDPDKLGALNDLVHPAVRKVFSRFQESHRMEPYVIFEAAILFESGASDLMDRTLVVAAPEELRIKRVMKRDQVQREEVLARMKNQQDPEKINAQADYLVINDENKLLLPQIIRLHHLFLKSENNNRSQTRN